MAKYYLLVSVLFVVGSVDGRGLGEIMAPL